MAQDEVHVGDVGTIFRTTIQDGDEIVDISLASSKKLFFRKPDGTVLEKDASFTDDGTDGQMEYTVQTGDLDLAGAWRLQGRVQIGNGRWSSDVHVFQVHRNLDSE